MKSALRGAASLAALLALASAQSASAEGLYLYVIPTEVRSRTPIDPARPLRIAAFVADPRALAERFPGSSPRVADDHVELSLGQQPIRESVPHGSLREPTFVADYDEPAVDALRQELIERHGPQPSREELTAFVHEAITDREMSRGWDLASQVAARRAGDCTEHAVLLAAIARSVKVPARIVLGAVIVSVDGRFATLGHAWVELHEGGQWHIADSTLRPEDRPLAYLSFGVLEDESPGFLLEIARISRNWIARVELLGNSDSPARRELD